jgi:hypothetical protein
VTGPHRPAQSVAALSLIVPALVLGALLVWFEIVLDPTQRDPVADMPFADTLKYDHFERASQYIHAGTDPNAPIPYRDTVLTDGDEITLAPLLIAVANERLDSVKMLLSTGLRLEAPANRYALCLARRRGYEAITELLTTELGDAAATAPCPAQTGSGNRILRPFSEGAGR